MLWCRDDDAEDDPYVMSIIVRPTNTLEHAVLVLQEWLKLFFATCLPVK